MDRRTKKAIFLHTLLPQDDIIISTLCEPSRFCPPIDHSMIYCSWCPLTYCPSFLVQQITMVHCVISHIIEILGRHSPTYMLKANSDAYHEPESQECKSNTQSPLFYSWRFSRLTPDSLDSSQNTAGK